MFSIFLQYQYLMHSKIWFQQILSILQIKKNCERKQVLKYSKPVRFDHDAHHHWMSISICRDHKRGDKTKDGQDIFICDWSTLLVYICV